MQEIFQPDRPNLTVAKESCQSQWAQALLNQSSVMIWTSEHALASAITAAKASAVNGRATQLLTRAHKERFHPSLRPQRNGVEIARFGQCGAERRAAMLPSGDQLQ